MKNKLFLLTLVIALSCLQMTCTTIPKYQSGANAQQISNTEVRLENGKKLKMSQSAAEKTTIILVRHAEKILEVKNPDLTEEGKARAEKLKTILSDLDLDVVFSTDYNRTQQTAFPTANSKSLNIQSYNPRDLKGFGNMLLENYRGKNILVVGHSNTTPTLLNFLMEDTVVDAIDESDYTNLFVVNIFKDKKRKAVLLKF